LFIYVKILRFILACILCLFYTIGEAGNANAEDKTFLEWNAADFGAVGIDTIDDTNAIQKALDQAVANNGGLVVVPEGKYLLKSPLHIGSNTHLKLSDQTTFVRNANYSPMIRNNSNGAKGYEGNHNITIEGGTWEGNTKQFPSLFNHITMFHSDKIIVKNTRLLNSYGSHDIEFAGVQNGQVLDNYIDGYQGEKKKEAIQLDIVHNKLNFPGFGVYDNTPCHNILIKGNTIVNHSRGIGNHTSVPGVYQTNIDIENNHFGNIHHEGIDALDFNSMVIKNNQFDKVGLGIEIQMNAGTPKDPMIEIMNNQIKETKSVLTTPGYGIILEGNKAFPLENITVSGNDISNSQIDGIYLEHTNHSFFLNNKVNNSARNGLAIHWNSNGNTVQTNVLNNNKNYGVSVYQSNSNSIERNEIKYSGVNGIHLSTSSINNIVNDNSITNSKNYGLSLYKSKTNTIEKNAIMLSGVNGIQVSTTSQNNSLNQNSITESKNYGICIYKSTDNELIGNKVDNSGANGVQISTSSSNNEMTNNIISNSKWNGVNVISSHDIKMVGNGITSSGKSGINLDGSHKNFINQPVLIGNHVTGQKGYGVAFGYVKGARVEKNAIQSSGFSGISLNNYSVNNTVTSNYVLKNSNNGIQVLNHSCANISGNTIKESGLNGVYAAHYSTGNVVYHNTIFANKGNGIQISNHSNATINNNEVENNSQNGVAIYYFSKGSQLLSNEILGNKSNGVLIRKYSNAIIKDNKMYSSKNGLYLDEYSTGSSIENNTIKSNKTSGLFLNNHSTASISSNSLSNNGTGIFISNHASNSKILNNKLSFSKNVGIYLGNYSNQNKIEGNRILSSGSYGILLKSRVSKNSIKFNVIKGSSRKKNKTYSQIALQQKSTKNIIEKNTLNYGDFKNKAKYGIFLDSNSNGNIIKGNKIAKSGVKKSVINNGKKNVLKGNK
jgi:parallel beta-helix repeat protein